MPQAPIFKERAPKGVVCVRKRVGSHFLSQLAAIQLKECLHLENNPEIFNNIKDNLKELGIKHLDPHHAPSGQRDAITKIKAELRHRYPDIFDSEDKTRCLYLAIRIIYREHHWWARSHRHRHRRGALAQKGSLKHSKSIGHGRNGTKNSPKKSVEEIRQRYTEENISRRTNQEPLVPNLAVSQPTEIATSAQPASTPSSTVVNSSSQSSTQLLDSPAKISSGSHSTTSARQFGTGTQAVFNFLGQCTPSMSHLHHHFVNFGCSNEEYLLAVSSWPPEVVHNFLKQALTDRETGEVLVNSMDMLVLQTHFLAYYQM